MKKLKTLSLSLVVMAITLVAFFAVAPKAQAAEAGTLTSNAIVLQDDVYYTKYWTSTNYRLNCYNKIVVPARGYITFTANKPFDDEGELCSYDLTLYKPDGSVVWKADTGAQKDGFSDTYVYKIGLAAGTYYMNVDPNFYMYSNSAPIETEYKYKFTKSDYWEIEGNGTQATATKIALNKMYNGVYTDESYDTPYKDYYSVKLTKGVKYRVKFDNYAMIHDSGTLIFNVLDPSGENIIKYYGTESGNVTYWDITASKTGTYYLLLDNDCNEIGYDYKIGVYERDISVKSLKISLSTTTYKYNGKAKKPTVTVKDGDTKLKEGVHYTVKYPKGRKNIGEYKITITFKSVNYNGKRTIKFKIVPATIKESKITATQTTSSITLKWPKVSGATGYKVYQYSPSKEKYVQVANVKKNSFKKTGLKAGTTYEYKIKAYKKLSNGKVLEGAYSDPFKTATKCKKPEISGVYSFNEQEASIYWSRVQGATGYQVYYSTKKNSGFKKVTSTEYSPVEKEFSSSYKGKKVYFKVRAYTKVNGQTIYSDWSPVKSAVIK